MPLGRKQPAQRRAPASWILRAGMLLAGTMPTVTIAALTVSPEEMAQKHQWVQQHLLTADLPPFSFTYGGQPSSRLLPSWARAESDAVIDAKRTQHVITWTHGDLEVRCVVVEYNDYPVVEWTVYLKDVGTRITPILEEIQGMDTTMSREEGAEFVLNCNKGDYCAKDSYEPYQLTLNPSTVTDFTPLHIPDVDNEAKGIGVSESGKSCDGPKGWPYYNLQVPGGGIMLAIGWPGQWASSFARDASAALRVRAGQSLTHLYLKPGEQIRAPLIAMFFWRGGDVVRAQNLWRRWFIADNDPHVDGEPQQPTADIYLSLASFLLAKGTDDLPAWSKRLEAGIDLNDRMGALTGVEATWWPTSTGIYHAPKPGEQTTTALKEATDWWNTGTWEVDPTKFVGGFRPLSSNAHAHGLTFMVWFEPERVGNPNSWLGKNHPEWLLPTNALTYGIHPSFDPILDEGNPEALKWLIDHVDAMIKSEGIDVYREDMNGAGPWPAWHRNDATDRQGMTENLYVQGHLAFWDELRRRNPHLRIDSCASGGRRNDLESMRRGVSMGNRSDFMFKEMPNVVEGNQGQTYGLSAWLPFQGSYAYFHDTYSYRSFILPSFGIDGDLPSRIKAYGEWRQISPYMLGDYYPLTSYSLQLDQWIAWQFDRPDLSAGLVQAFRRPDSPYESASFRLHGLDPGATYDVENLDGGKETRAGDDLMERGLAIKATSAPAAMVFIYKRQQ